MEMSLFKDIKSQQKEHKAYGKRILRLVPLVNLDNSIKKTGPTSRLTVFLLQLLKCTVLKTIVPTMDTLFRYINTTVLIN